MILDTNALSGLLDGDSLLEPIVDGAPQIALPVIVLGEYLFGIRRSRNRTKYEHLIKELVRFVQVLVVDEETAKRYAEIRDELKHAGRPIPGNDLWIAALARQYDLPLLSRDQHFDFVTKLTRISW